jgi:SNF2 family DNA or RNA helicase
LFWLVRNGLGAVLADDMGLGKTIQTIALPFATLCEPAADC